MKAKELNTGNRLKPAKTCAICNKPIAEIGGWRLVAQHLRGVKLSDKFQGGGNKDYPHQSFKLNETSNKYVVVWGEKSKWTIEAIQRIYNQYQYLLDPHGAVGLLAAESYLEENHPINPLIVLETAHPSKFLSAYEALDIQVHIPERLAIKAHAKDLSVNLPNDYSQFINWFFDAHNS